MLPAALPSTPSAVPALRPPAGPARDGLVLAAGLAVCEALRELGLEAYRMRWPNDILVRDRKLAGLLLDQFTADRVVVGIGLNVRNQPEAFDAALLNQTARLADFLAATPPLTEIAILILRHLRRLALEISRGGFPAVLARVNALWGPPRRVELALDGGRRQGVFLNVDEGGCLLLREDSGAVAAYPPFQVHHLQEI
jgi:BirA family biotin operon repressor/biotin-[acetyl-CoA-carboxylase] ligase